MPYMTPRDTDPLHEELQAHIAKCKQCSTAAESYPAAKLGEKSHMCEAYFQIMRAWQGYYGINSRESVYK